jgi:hypothetical protein
MARICIARAKIPEVILACLSEGEIFGVSDVFPLPEQFFIFRYETRVGQ